MSKSKYLAAIAFLLGVSHAAMADVVYTVTVDPTKDTGVTAQRTKWNATCATAPPAANCTTYATNQEFIQARSIALIEKWYRQKVVDNQRNAITLCISTGDCSGVAP